MYDAHSSTDRVPKASTIIQYNSLQKPTNLYMKNYDHNNEKRPETSNVLKAEIKST